MKTYGIDQDTARALKPCVSFRKLSDTVFDALHDVSQITIRGELPSRTVKLKSVFYIVSGSIASRLKRETSVYGLKCTLEGSSVSYVSVCE